MLVITIPVLPVMFPLQIRHSKEVWLAAIFNSYIVVRRLSISRGVI
jgi:hypothetical protein